MHAFYISALFLLSGLNLVLTAPVNETLEERQTLVLTPPCSNYGYMSMGQLEAYNTNSGDRIQILRSYTSKCLKPFN